jgi:hypothetical protein
VSAAGAGEILPSAGQSAALIAIVALVLAWLRWRLRAPWPLLAAIVAWQALMAGLALAGYFSRFDQPWRAVPTVAASAAMALWLARRPFVGHGLGGAIGTWLSAAPAWAWVALQGFRVPLEVLLYSLYRRGVIGPQMTFVGYNFDIAVGAAALPLAAWMAWRVQRQRPAAPHARHSPAVVVAFNLLGLALLLNIVVIAVLSVPFPFQLFTAEPANRVVAGFPFVWLPTLLVPVALLGHVVSLRRALWARQAALSIPSVAASPTRSTS